MCLHKTNMKEKKLFCILKKGVGSGSISQRYGSGDPDPHQNVTDPQRCLEVRNILIIDKGSVVDTDPS